MDYNYTLRLRGIVFLEKNWFKWVTTDDILTNPVYSWIFTSLLQDWKWISEDIDLHIDDLLYTIAINNWKIIEN